MVLELTLQLTMLLASIGWLVLMVAIIRVLNYCRKFDESILHNGKELLAINNQLRKVNECLGSVLLELSSANRTIRGALEKQTGVIQVEEVNYAEIGIARELRHEDELIAKAKREARAKAGLGVQIGAKNEPEVKADTGSHTKTRPIPKIKIESKPKSENGTQIEVKTETKPISKIKTEPKAATPNEPKIPLPPHRQGPVVEIIPKMKES